MAESDDERDRRLPDDYTTAELHAIATRALASGDDYARALLRQQLEEEEFSERSDMPPVGRIASRARPLCRRRSIAPSPDLPRRTCRAIFEQAEVWPVCC